MMTVSQAPKTLSKDVRNLEISEVCELGNWLTKYLRLELEPQRPTENELLLQALVRNSREYESDLGIFGVDL